mmetsp:Transcript_87906/g.243904  ORF Transcript_87906/g.243904 Transcript_87906/m.243904 type:complete len:213 (-) Transcript_87906:1092-1730(-)
MLTVLLHGLLPHSLGSLATVQLVVGTWEEHLQELLAIDAPAAIPVEHVEELNRPLFCQANPQLRDHVAEFTHGELPLALPVEDPEEPRDVFGCKATLRKPVTGPAGQEYEVPVLPDLGEGIAKNANRHGHIKHAGHQECRLQAIASLSLWRFDADRHDCHDCEPHRCWQGLDTAPWLNKVNEGGEDQHNDQQHEKQKIQRLAGVFEDAGKEM